MMNIEVHDKKLLNSCCLSWSKPLVVLIRVSELFYEFKILGVHNISDPKRLGKDQLKFKGLEMKIEEENS